MFGSRTRPGPSPQRTRLAAVATIAVTALVAVAPPARSAPGDPDHGLVGKFCDATRITAERSAGITVAVFGARWDLMMPSAGTVDPGYVTSLGNALRTCAGAGMRVVLDAGLPYVPAWVRQLDGGSLRDQYGARPVNGQLDLVYSSAVRSAAGDYLRRLVGALPAYTVSAIRVGTATSGEIGLPGGTDGGKGHTDSWWAFGIAPQTGRGLAPGQSVSPMPGWVPGTRTWNGRAVTASAALNWWRWYERSVLQAEWFLARSVQITGFGGAVHLPAAGRGVLPAGLTAATSALLAGASRQDDSFARGLDYVDQMALLGQALPGVVIDLTSVDDASAVTARAASPPQDGCTLNDAAASTDPATPVASWSNLRFARAQVARAGLPAVGENPGPPGPDTGGVPGSDPETAQVTRSVPYARSCGLAALLFAFEDDLFTGRSGITLADYANAW